MSRLSAIALVLIAAGSAHAAEKTLDRTFTVSPGGTLVVDADGAAIHVSGNDSNRSSSTWFFAEPRRLWPT